MSEAKFLRLKQVLELIPVSRWTWWRGVRSGRYPQPANLTNKIRVWRAADIEKYINRPAEYATYD